MDLKPEEIAFSLIDKETRAHVIDLIKRKMPIMAVKIIYNRTSHSLADARLIVSTANRRLEVNNR